MLAGSVIAVALAAGISFWSFGLYVEPLEREFGWSRAEVSGGFSVGVLASALAALLGIMQAVSIPHLASPIFAGAIFDATGAYDWALVMLIASMGLSAVLFWVAWRLPRPQFGAR